MDNVIREFISSIEKGPFKCLRDYEGETASEYIESLNKNIGDIYDCAVNQAWLDMCRTVHDASEESKENTKEAAAAALRSYFEGKAKTKPAAFDGWFDTIRFDVAAPAAMTVGQTQKILNMAFKYLYCCGDLRSKYEAHFRCCHMPLDSYTLRWYKNSCPAKDYNGEKWSKLDDLSLYHRIQNEIRDVFVGQNILQQEFLIWQTEKDTEVKRATIADAKRVMHSEVCPEDLKSQLQSFIDTLSPKTK